LLVLDEPTSGLDPEGSMLFKEIILERQRAGTTVLLSSHLLAEVESIADRIAVCHQGRIIALDSLDGMRQSLALPTRLVLKVDNPRQAEAFAMSAGAHHVEHANGALRLTVEAGRKASVFRSLETQGVVIEDLRTEDPSLEDIFMAVVQRAHASTQEVSR
ncbi:MAG TPA: DUF4162 domain-containing protein, partial [Stenomitos sp.]